MITIIIIIIIQQLYLIICKENNKYFNTLHFLHHSLLGPEAISDSFYGKPKKAIHYGSVNCDGSEEVITNCLYVQYSLEHGKELNIHVEVAGVNCQGNLTHDNISTTDSLTTSISTHLTTTGKLQYISSTLSTGGRGLTNSTRGIGVSDTSISGSEVVILSIGIIALIFGVTALIIG